MLFVEETIYNDNFTENTNIIHIVRIIHSNTIHYLCQRQFNHMAR